MKNKVSTRGVKSEVARHFGVTLPAVSIGIKFYKNPKYIAKYNEILNERKKVIREFNKNGGN